MTPVAPFGKTSPVFSYPYERTRETLARLAKEGAPDTHHGWKMEYSNPLSGGHAMPTIAAFIQLLPKGFKTARYRATDATVFCAAEGEGTSRIGDQTFTWGPRDIFVAPSWQPVSHSARAEAVLFSFSDRPAQKALGLWRESVIAD